MNVHSSFMPDSQKVEIAQHSSTLCTINKHDIFIQWNIVLFQQQIQHCIVRATKRSEVLIHITTWKEARHKGPYGV